MSEESWKVIRDILEVKRDDIRKLEEEKACMKARAAMNKTTIMRIILGLSDPTTPDEFHPFGKPYTQTQIKAADMNEDGVIDMGDVVALERKQLGLT